MWWCIYRHIYLYILHKSKNMSNFKKNNRRWSFSVWSNYITSLPEPWKNTNKNIQMLVQKKQNHRLTFRIHLKWNSMKLKVKTPPGCCCCCCCVKNSSKHRNISAPQLEMMHCTKCRCSKNRSKPAYGPNLTKARFVLWFVDVIHGHKAWTCDNCNNQKIAAMQNIWYTKHAMV